MIQLSTFIFSQSIYRYCALCVLVLHVVACGHNSSIDGSKIDSKVQEQEQEQPKPNFQLHVSPTTLIGDSTTFICSIKGDCSCIDVSQLKLKMTNTSKSNIHILYDNATITIDSPGECMLGWKTLGDRLNDIPLIIQSKGKKLASGGAILAISLQYNGSLVGTSYQIYYYTEPSKDLLEAAARGDIKGITYLLSGTPEINELIDQNGNTAIHLVTSSGSKQALEELLKDSRWDNIEPKNNDGNTPLHLAAAIGNLEIIKLLIAHGANRQIKNKADKTPLDMANKGGYKAAIEVLKPTS